MPTTKPRIIITVEHETKAVLDRLQRASNKHASRFIAEVINEATPLFAAMADAAEASKSKQAEAFDTLAGALARVQVDTAQLQLQMHNARQVTRPPAAKKRPAKKAVKGGRRASAR